MMNWLKCSCFVHRDGTRAVTYTEQETVPHLLQGGYVNIVKASISHGLWVPSDPPSMVILGQSTCLSGFLSLVILPQPGPTRPLQPSPRRAINHLKLPSTGNTPVTQLHVTVSFTQRLPTFGLSLAEYFSLG